MLLCWIRLILKDYFLSSLGSVLTLGCSFSSLIPALISHLIFTLMQSHLQFYGSPSNLNFCWNLGFFLGFSLTLQILTGLLLALHFTPDISFAFYSIMHIIREVYFGFTFRYIHSCGASLTFAFVFCHLARAFYYLWLSFKPV